ncbi:hypothetical protein GCM10017691_59510 [Pseudonocardia petroleophila]
MLDAGTRGEAVGGVGLGGGRREGRVDVEVGAGGPGRGDDGGPVARRECGAVGDQRAGDQLQRAAVLADRDELAAPGQQVVVDAAGQRQQDLVGRVARGPVVHRPSRSVRLRLSRLRRAPSTTTTPSTATAAPIR